MARYRFEPGVEHPARLLAVRKRPVENRDGHIYLLRLEFELFSESAGELRSRGEMASRDLVIGAAAGRDSGVQRYARALSVERAERLDEWVKADRQAPWVSIVFGEPDAEDDRQPFDRIEAYDPATKGNTVIEFDVTLAEKWVTPTAAAKRMGRSAATIRRRVDKYKAEWGAQVVRTGRGGHRKINVLLLQKLESAKREESHVLRVVELDRLRRLRKELVNKNQEIDALKQTVADLQDSLR